MIIKIKKKITHLKCNNWGDCVFLADQSLVKIIIESINGQLEGQIDKEQAFKLPARTKLIPLKNNFGVLRGV